MNHESFAQLVILCVAGWLAWISIKTQEGRPEDRGDKEPSETARQGRIFRPAGQGRLAGISRNGGWWE